ncbi:MAG: DUF4342 domain-containing protein [Paracoccaceae bacterium]
MSESQGTENTRSWIDEIEVKGEELVARVKQLAADNKVKRIRVVEPDGDIALEIPLTYGAIAGGAVAIAAPVLAILGTLAAFAVKLRIEVVHEEPVEEAKEPPVTVET